MCLRVTSLSKKKVFIGVGLDHTLVTNFWRRAQLFFQPSTHVSAQILNFIAEKIQVFSFYKSHVWSKQSLSEFSRSISVAMTDIVCRVSKT